MKVLVVSNGFPPRGKWGTEFYTKELVTGLVARGHEVSVLHPDRTGGESRYTLQATQENGVPVYLLHNPGDPRKSFEDSYSNPEVERVFENLLKRIQPDLVHFTYLLWGLSARLPVVAREVGVPAVVTLTDYGLLCHRGQMFDWRLRRCFGPHPPEVCARCIREPSRFDDTPARLVARRAAVRTLAAVGGLGVVVATEQLARREGVVREALEAADHMIAPTEVLAETFLQWGVRGEKLSRLVYSLDDTPLHSARRPPEGAQVNFGFLGQFTPHKGLGTLLAAVERMEHRLPESVEPWELRLFGAPAGNRHRRFADTLFARDRGPRVRVLGSFEPEEAPGVLAELSAIVIPSEWDENAPLTALQARAAGIPVVASNVRGIAEVIEHGVHGLLFEPGDDEGLADAMRAIILHRMVRIEDPGLPLELGEHLDRVEEIYRSVL